MFPNRDVFLKFDVFPHKSILSSSFAIKIEANGNFEV